MTTRWDVNDILNMLFDIGLWGYFIWCIWSLHEVCLSMCVSMCVCVSPPVSLSPLLRASPRLALSLSLFICVVWTLHKVCVSLCLPLPLPLPLSLSASLPLSLVAACFSSSLFLSPCLFGAYKPVSPLGSLMSLPPARSARLSLCWCVSLLVSFSFCCFGLSVR